MSATFTSGAVSSSKVSGKHNGKAIVDGQQTELDDTTPTPGDTVATTDSPPENTIKPRDFQAEFNASMERSARSVGKLLDATALDVYCEVGGSCHDTLAIAKAMYDDISARAHASSDWSSDLYDDVCHQLSVKVQALFPHLFAANKEKNDAQEAKGKRRDPIRIQDYVLVSLTVRLLTPIVGDGILRLSYGLLANYLCRSVVSFSKVKMTATIKDGWSEWIKLNVSRLIAGEITVGNVISAMKEHAERLDKAAQDKKISGKSADEIAAMEAEAAQARIVRERTARESKVNSQLTTSLCDAMSGVFKPSKIAEIIHKCAADTGCNLSLTPDPKTITVDAILDVFHGMIISKRYSDIRAICTACAAMAATVDIFDPPKPAVKLADAS